MSSIHLHHTNNNNNLNNEGIVNKIRKRGCSSSSSSSLVRKYRFKRAILVGKKAGSTTPVPLWKTSTTPPSMATPPLHHSQLPPKDKELSVSARKLAATLWEINDLPSADPVRGRDKAANFSSSRSGLLRPHMSDPSQSPLLERMKGFEGDGHKRRVSGLSHQLQSGDYLLEGLDSCSSARLIEKNCGKCTDGVKSRLKEARSGLSTSKKLLKVLNQVCIREHQSSTKSLILALGSELDRVCHQIDLLIHEDRSNQNDMEYVIKCFAEEKAAWKSREREKIHDALKNAAEELKVEKKLRRQTERLNKKIAKEMANVKASHLKASKELEREKRAKEILEQICDELANGIGEDRAQVEELKRESAKVREEVEKEREMLQLADVLREERVQMKLSEAKYQFEEKNDVLEKLRNEFECFMRTKDEENGVVSPECEKIKDLEAYFNNIYGGLRNAEKDNGLDVGDDDDGDNDSDESDLHSIELSMDNRGCMWSYAFEDATQDDSKRVSVDSIGRKSLSGIQWGSICFNKRTSSFKKRDFVINDILEGSNHLDPETSLELLSRARIQDDKDEAQSNRTIKGLQDSMPCSNPVQRNDQLLTLQCTGEEAGKNALLALEGDTI
ncbi:uncharacterized protein At5g41620-like [Lotus japonicus]|uniref:uncharacterized protein At5g41620-like n=1 Tax=Lotus japonicus TaxID=34305 RepID=UPI00258E7A3A|nr:uncharacterized protein At5g41620-like [Lotus japonicus]